MKHLKIIIIILNLIGLAFQYGLSIYRSDNGLRVANLNREAIALQKENSELSSQYLELASLSQVEKRAAELKLTNLPTTTLAPITVAEAITY